MTGHTEGSVWGATATMIGTILGWVSVESAKEAAVLAAIGAVVGFLVTSILKFTSSRIKAWWIKRRAR